MESLLVKMFATALALSQVTTTPSAVRTDFDRQRDQAEVEKILHAGCAHMLQAFELENINIDDLIATAMDDPQAIEGAKVLRGIDFADLLRGYKQFCKNEKVDRPAVDLGAVIDFYNEAAAIVPPSRGATSISHLTRHLRFGQEAAPATRRRVPRSHKVCQNPEGSTRRSKKVAEASQQVYSLRPCFA